MKENRLVKKVYDSCLEMKKGQVKENVEKRDKNSDGEIPKLARNRED